MKFTRSIRRLSTRRQRSTRRRRRRGGESREKINAELAKLNAILERLRNLAYSKSDTHLQQFIKDVEAAKETYYRGRGSPALSYSNEGMAAQKQLNREYHQAMKQKLASKTVPTHGKRVTKRVTTEGVKRVTTEGVNRATTVPVDWSEWVNQSHQISTSKPKHAWN